MGILIYYDGECPFCSRYVSLLRLRSSLGEPVLIDVRTSPRDRERLAAHGINLDQGMAVNVDGVWHDGADAVHVLAALSTPSSSFNRLNRAIFSSRPITRMAYPFLRAGRNATLFALGRERIHADSAAQRAPSILFNMSWGLFAVLHVIAYAFFFKVWQPLYLSTWIIGAAGLALLLRPASGRIFVILLAAMCVDAWQQMPVYSNHTIIKNFFLLGMMAAGVWQWFKGGTWAAFFNDFASLGRVLLVVMYVFGVFHKINSGFLDPTVSCAVALWKEMPGYLSWIDADWFHQLAIWGTLIIETVILVCLLLRRTRTIAIGVGIAFHALLAMSGFAMYVPFSMLTVALHVLFIERDSADRILKSGPMQIFNERVHTPLGIAILAIWLGAITGLSWNGSYSEASMIWLLAIVPFAWLVLRHGQNRICPSRAPALLWSQNAIVNLLAILFFFNCITPYLGLKNAQSINMFANLRLEGGVSNHLLLRNSPGPFGYLQDIVRLTGSSGAKDLVYFQHEGLWVTYYHLLDQLERHPYAIVSFERGGRIHASQTAATLAGDIDSILHPRWFRNWFNFAPVDISVPKPCALDR